MNTQRNVEPPFKSRKPGYSWFDHLLDRLTCWAVRLPWPKDRSGDHAE